MGKINLKITPSNEVERTQLVKNYLNDIAKFDVLSPAEERKLFERVKAGDEKAKAKIIESEQKYVYAIAKRFDGRDKLMDLVQEGNAGLMEAIEYFDPDKGVRFLSFASWYVERNIKKYLTNDGLLVKKSNNFKTTYKITKAKNIFFAENGRYPTAEELVDFFEERFHMPIKDKRDIYDVRLNSINSNFDGEDSSEFENSAVFTSRTASNNDYSTKSENDYMKTLIESALNGLKDRDRQIVKMSYGIGYEREYAYPEIAEVLGLTGERVRQICISSVKKLKSIMKLAANSNV